MTYDMAEGKPLRAMLVFSIPVLIGNLLQQFYSLADTLIVGRTLGPVSLGAVGSTGTITSFVLLFISGLTTGLSVVLGQRFGARDRDGVRRSAAASAVIGIVAALILTVVTVLLTRSVLELMMTPDDLIGEAHEYMVIIFWGVPATLLYNLISNMIRALGDSRTPLIFLLVSSLTNIALDFLFILAFGMGVSGAAWATVAATLISAVACLIYAGKHFPELRFRSEDCKAAFHDMGAHLRVGLPMGLQMAVMCIGLIAMQAALNRLGSTVVSSFTIGSKVNAFAETIPLSFSAVIATYVAQNFGARKFRRIRTGVKQCILMSVSTALLCTLIIELLCGSLIRLFIENPTPSEVLYAERFLRIVSPFYMFLSLLIIFRSSIQSMGNSVLPFAACILELVIRIGCSLYAISAESYLGVCLATPCSWVGAALFLAICYAVVSRRHPSEDILE